MYNLIYMAKPVYGGWVTFTAHLALKTNSNIFKISKKNEKNKRNYGYGTKYHNQPIDTICKLPNLWITALDKHFYEYLHLFPTNTRITIHDPTEMKNKNNPLLHNDLIIKFNVITIRELVQQFLINKYNINSKLISHPFYHYPKDKEPMNNYAVSIARIDFDKNTDIILKCNQLLELNNYKTIQLFGAENRLYVHHKLKDLNFHKYWNGKYPKTLPMTYNGKDILKNCQFMVDLSVIKGDGGGTQYTFLEAIYNECILILHKEWINKSELFVDRYNCLAVENENELFNILTSDTNFDKDLIIQNSKKILFTDINS